MLKFKERLRLLRALNCVSQEQFAKALGISRMSVSHYEVGRNVPDIEVLQKTAKFFNVSTDYLLGLSDVKNTDAALQVICKELKLSEKAIEHLHNTKEYSDLILSSDEWSNFVIGVVQFLQDSENIEYRKFLATQRLLMLLDNVNVYRVP